MMEIIEKLISKGMTPEEVSNYLDLELKEVKALLASLKKTKNGD